MAMIDHWFYYIKFLSFITDAHILLLFLPLHGGYSPLTNWDDPPSIGTVPFDEDVFPIEN